MVASQFKSLFSHIDLFVQKKDFIPKSASSESIRFASCVLSKQPQINASKLTCNLENREDSSRSESCDMEELKSNLHDEVIAKLDKNIIVEQELKQQLSSPA